VPHIAVVAYPVFDETDLAWIESIRARYDPQADRIAPHFTLVFPVDASAGILDELAAVAGRHAAIRFVLRSAIATPDLVRGGAHVFLVPDEGRDAIACLHDDLYAGTLRTHLREDGPFVPHITVAAQQDLRWCEAYAERLNDTLRPMHATIESLSVVAVDPGGIRRLAHVDLAPRVSSRW
jgi:2'-5' RNA ligase